MKVRQLNIHNLTIAVDIEKHATDPVAEAHKVVALVNAAISHLDGTPTVIFETRVVATYSDYEEEE